MADGSRWYYVAGNERKGPVSADQIAVLIDTGTIDGETLVWTDGMTGWLPLRETPLRDEAPVPPRLPPRAPRPAPAEEDFDPGVSSFKDAITTCFRKYVTFSGRANRPEFWWFFLFGFLGSIATSIVDAAIFRNLGIDPLNGLFSLAILLPSLAVSVRRLHDTDRSGWWVLLHLIPIVGTIILIIWFCQRGTPGRNRFG